MSCEGPRANSRRTGEIERSGEGQAGWRELRAVVTNSGSQSAQVRFGIGSSASLEVSRTRGLKLRNGEHIIKTSLGAGEERKFVLWYERLSAKSPAIRTKTPG